MLYQCHLTYFSDFSAQRDNFKFYLQLCLISVHRKMNSIHTKKISVLCRWAACLPRLAPLLYITGCSVSATYFCMQFTPLLQQTQYLMPTTSIKGVSIYYQWIIMTNSHEPLIIENVISEIHVCVIECFFCGREIWIPVAVMLNIELVPNTRPVR